MSRRRVIQRLALCGALVAALAVTAVLWRRHAPNLPPLVRYENRPALFNDAVRDSREEARRSGLDPSDVRALAHLYQANGLNDEARACYEILRKGGEGLTATDHYYLADIAQYQGDLERALVELDETIKAAPDYLPARLALSDVLFKAGRTDEAAKEDQETLGATPNQPQAMFQLARIDLQKGNDDAAIGRLEALLSVHPEMTSGAGLLAQVFDRKGDAERAKTMRQWSRQRPEPVPEDPWMEALLSDSYDGQRLGLKFEEYFASGQIGLAVPLLKRMEELDPKSPVPQLLRGWTAAREHRDAEAVVQYRSALDKGGDPEKICPYLAEALVGLGRVSEAQTLIERYHALKPDSVPILIAYADVAVKTGDKTLARTLLASVVEKEPYLTSANMTLASMLWASGDRDGAAKCLERVIKVSANDIASRALLGEYYLGRRDPVPAITPLEQALALEHTETTVRRNLTYMLFTAYIEAGRADSEKGSLKDAVTRYFDRAIALVPTNPNGYASKAAACARLGEFADAAQALRKLGDLQPDNPTVYLSLGDVLYQGGDRDEARINWQKALALAPAGNADLRGAIGARLSGPITEETFR
jgi:tetratricopeptide (TPR) repeat protein